MCKANDSIHWKLGVFYYNPDDPSEVVERMAWEVQSILLVNYEVKIRINRT